MLNLFPVFSNFCARKTRSVLPKHSSLSLSLYSPSSFSGFSFYHFFTFLFSSFCKHVFHALFVSKKCYVTLGCENKLRLALLKFRLKMLTVQKARLRFSTKFCLAILVSFHNPMCMFFSTTSTLEVFAAQFNNAKNNYLSNSTHKYVFILPHQHHFRNTFFLM